MTAAIGLLALVAVILWAQRQKACDVIFRWLPVPLWCYVLPLAAVSLHLLPQDTTVYRLLTARLLPFALGCLLLGTDLPAIGRSGWKAVAAALLGAAGVLLGASAGVWILQAYLPVEAWKGAGALSATWTGGTMNLLAMQSLLHIPDAVFAPLIVVDALIAYGWMALLMALSTRQQAIDRWLKADARLAAAAPRMQLKASPLSSLLFCVLTMAALTALLNRLAARLPMSAFVSSAAGWSALLMTTAALSLSLFPKIRAEAAECGRIGYPCLYVVLASTGAQATPSALGSMPAWVLLGLLVAITHGAVLIAAGKALRIPLGLLATASQANIGGVVSAPLVGAVYNQSLIPVGLILAMAGNALGTYFGLAAAALARCWLRV